MRSLNTWMASQLNDILLYSSCTWNSLDWAQSQKIINAPTAYAYSNKLAKGEAVTNPEKWFIGKLNYIKTRLEN